MISRQKPVLKALWFVGVAVIVYFSAERAEELIDFSKFSDKWGHGLAYGIVAFVGYIAATTRVHRLIIALVMAGLGLLMEIVQIYVPGRAFEFADWGADVAGVIVAMLFYTMVRQRFRGDGPAAR